MKQRVLKPLAGDLHAELVADSEVAGRQSSGMMNLAEEYRLARPMQTSPLGHTSFECSPRGIGKPTEVRLLQPFEQRDRFQSRFAFELPLHLGPDVVERIDARPIVSNRFPL